MRLMLRVAAASVGPVVPAETRPSARPSPTARAAWTIEASGRERTALTGSSPPSIRSGASTMCTRAPGSPMLASGPNSSTSSSERAAPSDTVDGPPSAPLASSAITARGSYSSSGVSAVCTTTSRPE